MSDARPGWVDGVLTAAVVVAVVVGLWSMHSLNRSAEVRRREESARVSRLVSLKLSGESAPAVAMRAGANSVAFPGGVDRPLLLYVRGPDCRACDRMDEALLGFLRDRRSDEPQLWAADESGPEGLRDRFGGVNGVRIVHPNEPLVFARRYRIEQVPYLAFIDRAGRIQQVRVGYVAGFDVREFVRGEDR